MTLSQLIPKLAVLTVGRDGVISAAAGDWKGIAGVDSSMLVGLRLEDVLSAPQRQGAAEFLTGPEAVEVNCAFWDSADGNRHVVVSERGRLAKLCEAIAVLAHPAVAGGMAANLAHEFNNLFSAIAGFVELAQTTGKEETIRKALRVTDKNIERATKLSKALLQYGRRIGARAEVCNPASAIEEVFLLARKGLEKAKVHAEVNLRVLRDGVFDVGAVQHAFFAVLDNAKKFAGPEGRVFVDIEFDEENEMVCVSVSDTGPGVSDDIKERIFEPFFSGPEDPEPGLGIGLALACEALAGIGGAIEVRKNKDGLNTFALVFPMQSSDVSEAL